MIIMYETRSFSEARSMDSLRHVVFSATALFLILYAGLPTYSTIVQIFASIFLLFLLVLLKNLVIQIFRIRLKPTTWKIDLNLKRIKYSTLPWKFNFKDIKAFYIPESGLYVEFIMKRKYYRIWKSKLDQDRDLFEKFIGALDALGNRTNVEIEIPSYPETRKKAIFSIFVPYTITYIAVMYMFKKFYLTLYENHHVTSSFVIVYMVLVVLTARILYYLNIRKVLKSDI